ncbi:MAG TPA: hypothetical protein VEV16_03290 [Daejeonella sp.]|nr:hypothetical protein [Daejeonella sp.]
MFANKKYLLIAIIIAALVWMLVDALRQPGTEALKGNFEQKAYIRNEQNTGPVVRIYAVSVQDTLWKEMELYGSYMPHTKYGTTRVYFFQSGKPVPDKLSLEAENIPEEFQSNCIGLYEKDEMSQYYLTKFPFDRLNSSNFAD